MRDKNYLRSIGALDRSYIVGANNAEGISTLDYLVFAAGGTIEDVTTPEVVSQYIRSISQSVSPFPLNNDHLNLIDFLYTFPRDEQEKLSAQTIIDMTTDTNFVVPSVLFARLITEASDQTDVFMYLLDHYPQVKDPSSPLKGSNHGHDVLFEFDLTPSLRADNMNNYIVVGTPTNSPLYGIFGGAVATFAKTGIPVSQLQTPLTWPRFDPLEENFIAVALEPEVRSHLYAQRVSLWLDFLPRMGSQTNWRSSRVAFP
ncbi:carboxylic ester hydrolase [Elysia marginata]|uniref:Carboxylic ester hydrolase n=1 Tax=Elysia marginata TaxID=1093978 RepID=A0AAV4I7E7_9GAST|nr:carboxylic ester hydrolase [Elysia marginata]